MFQEYQVYAMSIADNILPGFDETNLDRIENAAKFAGLTSKINDLPKGFYTEVTKEFSEDGVVFSGGESQKLAIARAYAANQPVLILDEPSGNLDPFAESDLIKKINQMSDGRPVILVTHNMEYAKNVDLVLYFENGRVIESGTPKQLMNQQGAFFKMVGEQSFANYEI